MLVLVYAPLNALRSPPNTEGMGLSHCRLMPFRCLFVWPGACHVGDRQRT